ncbi:MAG: hypothetical protein KIT84_07730 [Labilithrix sp.]|nr:hypothetical protein [Labilithrix sp.]MCW5810886.1 hypothetical protein [Labilithrix sp.]
MIGDATTPGQNDGDATTDPPPSGPPAVQYIGRFDTRDPAGPKCAWPGCRIIARFSGTKVSARFNEINYTWMEGTPSEWDVVVDGAITHKLVTPTGTHDFVLAEDLPPGDHKIELYKRSEAQNGITQFLGYDFAGGTLLSPPARKTRRIEIIGDSQPAGFGMEGVGLGPDCPGTDWAARWENFHKSVGTLMAKDLNAEIAGTCYSGKGVFKNIWHPDKEPMPMLFLRADPIDPRSTWDHSQFVPAAVIVMLGGNDFAVGQPYDEGPATLAQFSDAYEQFAKDIRAKYPDTHLFLVVSPSTNDVQPAGRDTRTNVMAGVRETVTRRNAGGDGRVYEVIPPIARDGEMTGCNGHGSPEYHRRLADDLLPIVRAKTGWN